MRNEPPTVVFGAPLRGKKADERELRGSRWATVTLELLYQRTLLR
jgi:hypothetical protein